MPKSGEKKWKQKLRKPLSITHYVWERKLQRAHLSLSPLPSPLSIYINVLGSDTEIQTVFCQGRQSGGGWRQYINLTYLQSSQWSPLLPCSSSLPDLCGQICWRLGTPYRLRFLQPSGSSFWVGVRPGWWRSAVEQEAVRRETPWKALFSQSTYHAFLL